MPSSMWRTRRGLVSGALYGLPTDSVTFLLLALVPGVGLGYSAFWGALLGALGALAHGALIAAYLRRRVSLAPILRTSSRISLAVPSSKAAASAASGVLTSASPNHSADGKPMASALDPTLARPGFSMRPFLRLET
jgi:hypothetical protein